MASKNLMSVNPVTQVNDSDMFYTVQGSTTDGRVSAIQISEFVKLGLTKADVGLANVDNTSDLDKPVSNATQAALDDKQDELVSGVNIKTINGQSVVGSGNLTINTGAVDSVNGKTGTVVLSKADVGLSNVDNTSDVNKPISTATQLALDDKQDLLQSGVNIKTVNGQSILGSGNVEISGGGSSEIIRTPVAVTPLTGTTEFPVDGTLQASPYAPLYSADTREFREFQIDTATGDFTNPVAEAQVDADAWSISPAIPEDTDLKWRCRDKSVKGDYSEWSEPQSFKTYDVYVVTPAILSPTEGGTLEDRDDPVVSSAYQPINTVETHAASYWEFYSEQGVLVHSTGRDTTNLTTYQPPLGIIGGLMSVRVRYEGSGGLLSEWSAAVSFEGISAGYGKYLAVAHGGSRPFVTTYGVDIDSFNVLAEPSSTPASSAWGCAFSKDGVFKAVATGSLPYVMVYKRAGDTFTELSSPDILPAGGALCVSFSPEGNHMVVGHNNAPYITIYERSGNTFTKLPNPSTVPTDLVRGVAFSADGVYMAAAHSSSPVVTIYKRSGNTFTKLANPSTLPSGTGYGVAFSPDGTHMAVAHTYPPYITIYKRSGDTFTKLENPNVRPTNESYSVAFSPDGSYLAVGHLTWPNLTIYSRAGDTFTKLADPSVLPPAQGNGVAFSEDGLHLAVAHTSSPFVTIYKMNGNVFTKLANPSTLPAGQGNGVAFWPSALYPST